MKCIKCEKEINYHSEKYEMFGYDDFIHTNCRPAMNKEMDDVSNMSGSEFYGWMGLSKNDISIEE